MHSSSESCYDLLHLTGQKYLMLTFKINDFDRTEIKFVSKKMLPPFCKKPFLGRKKKKKGSVFQKEYFDETAESRKSCCIEEMSSTSILGLIQAI